MVELSMGRNDPNGAWQYPPPPDLSPQNLDWDTWLNDAPKIPFDPIRFARWRCWKEYGTGVGGDLMVHLLSGMLMTLGWNEAPRSATSLGGIFRWKDGRNMPDTLLVLFDYHGIPVYVRLNLGCATPETARFLGPKGVMEANGAEIRLTRQRGIDTSPSYYSGGFPAKMRAEYVNQWLAEHEPPIGQGTDRGRHCLSRQRRLGRCAPASLDLLPSGEIAQSRHRRCGVRQSRGHRLPYGERIVFPQSASLFRRSRQGFAILRDRAR